MVRRAFGLDATSLLRASAKIGQIEKGVSEVVKGGRTARRISNYALDEIRRQTRIHLDRNPTGALEDSWKVRSRATREESREWVVSSPLPYARIHDEGGIIRPKKAQALTIPVTALARNIKQGPKAFPGRLRSVPWGLIDLQGTTQFIFRQRVRIRATRYIQIALANASDFALMDTRRRLSRILRDSLRSL